MLVTLASGIYLNYRQWDFDDAYIAYRIVRNIINGHGWAYNIGESHNPSTSVLNIVLIAAFSCLTGDIRLAAHIIGTVAVLMAGLVGYELFRDKFGNSIGVLVGYLLVRKLGNNFTWGLECNLFIAFLMLFVLFEERRKNSWPLLGVLVLTRPDGILMVGLKWLKKFVSRRQFSAQGLFIVLIILMPWLIFSLHRFHQFLPDTFSQKIWQGHSGYWGTGHVYLSGLIFHYITSSGLLPKTYMLLAVVGMFLMKRDRSHLLYITIFVLLQQLAYTIFNVPMYHWYRALPDFLIVISALYAVGTFLNGIQNRCQHRFASVTHRFPHLMPQFRRGFSLSVPLLMLIPAVLTLRSSYENPKVDQRDSSYTHIIKEVDKLYGQGRLTTMEVGSIGFNTNRTIVDICGLVSEKGQFLTVQRMDVFYSDPPELLLFHDPIWGYEAAIYTDYRFPVVYKLGMKIHDSYLPMQLYVRKDNFDLNNINEQLLEMYPAYQLDTRFNLNTLRPLSDGVVCLDMINAQLVKHGSLPIQDRPVLHLQGWAFDRKRNMVPGDIFILLIHEDGRIYSLRAERYVREDVAVLFKNSDLRMSGFQATGVIISLPRGAYKMVVAQQIQDYYYYVEMGFWNKPTQADSF